uniref:Uncharacterized protein n=1 Tax=Seriola dumerili TaxID=41447 RepID=A0A3B4V759_SERDU
MGKPKPLSCLSQASWHFKPVIPGSSRLLRHLPFNSLLFIAPGVCLVRTTFTLLLGTGKGHAAGSEKNHSTSTWARVTDQWLLGYSCTAATHPMVIPMKLLDIRQMRAINTGKASALQAQHIPKNKHQETPLYILCTEALLEDLPAQTSSPHFNFLFSEFPMRSDFWKTGEGVYAWIGINFVLGRFNHVWEAVVEVHVPGSESAGGTLVRKDLAGVLDMEEVAKNLLAEFNCGCDALAQSMFIRGFMCHLPGVWQECSTPIRYEENLIRRYCSLISILVSRQASYLRGTGDFDQCRQHLPTVPQTFYGFSEFYYCTEDVLRMGGFIMARKYTQAAKSYCATQWKTLEGNALTLACMPPHADLHRLNVFKSAWMYEVLHLRPSLSQPNYKNLENCPTGNYDKEVQWTLELYFTGTRLQKLSLIKTPFEHAPLMLCRDGDFLLHLAAT